MVGGGNDFEGEGGSKPYLISTGFIKIWRRPCKKHMLYFH